MDNTSMQKLLNSLALAGETMLVVGAAAWMFAPLVASILFAVGTATFIIGRMGGSEGDGSKTGDRNLTPTVRHLYRQRILSYILLVLAAVCIHLPAGFYFGIYMRRSMWFVPFIAFVIIEAYTAFRLPATEKK